MNGNVADKFLSSIDPDDPEYQRQLMRPAEIKEDVKLMEQRKRVSLILSSEAFREELEQIIESQLSSGPQSVSLLALQQIAEALQLPRSTGTQGGSTATPVRTAAPAAAAPLPINDIRGVESLNYSKGEKLLRCKLASACRLLDLFGWASPTPGALLSARVPDRDGAPPTFLTTPYGLLAHEITASALLKLDARGAPVDAGCTPFGPAATWRSLDAPLYVARPNLRCVLHVRTPATVALSATRRGLTRLTLEAVECGHVAMLDAAEAPAGDANVLLIRNNGIVCLGESVEEAFYFAQRAVQACEAQVAAAALGADQLCELDDAQCDAVRFAIDAQLAALPKLDADAESSQDAHLTKANGSDATNWMRGELEFEALMRYLDNAGFRTGYPYRIPVIKHGHAHKSREQHPEIELPPTASSLAEELQQFDLTHGSGRATQLLKEVSAAKKSATLPAGGIRKTPKAQDARTNAFPSTTDDIKDIVVTELRDAKPLAPVSVSVVAAPPAAPAKPQPEAAQSKPISPEKPQVAVAAQSAPPTTSSASPLARTESARTQPLPLANEYSNAGAVEIKTPVGNLSATASLQRPARVDRSKSERVPAASLKLEVSGTEEQPDEDGAGKKDKKNKSGIFASFSKKKEKAK